ncbi:MAG: hypothetical protein N3F05_03485 [Candidatus Diapherotrites archaeon]|nr:hypothetical protein [Candidatus Diapherotrites archaeon]
MRSAKLTNEDKKLIEIALNVIMNNRLETKSISASVGAALLSANGNVFAATNIKNYLSSPTSICAEPAAIASMFSSGERRIKTIVAVHMPDRKSQKWQIIRPCGACRHFISSFGNPWVIVSKTKKVRLKELYPLALKPFN